jgi:hypothetical protein
MGGDKGGGGAQRLFTCYLAQKKRRARNGTKTHCSSHESRPVDSVLQEYTFADYSPTGIFHGFFKIYIIIYHEERSRESAMDERFGTQRHVLCETMGALHEQGGSFAESVNGTRFPSP